VRRTWVYIDGVAYEKGAEPTRLAYEVLPDIKPYKSMITGEMITSRSRHREHLRDHGYTEIGNDSRIHAKPKPISAISQTRKALLIAQVNAMTNEQFKAAGRRDLERLRWNTRDIPDPLKEI
jgi:hypothetical protein